MVEIILCSDDHFTFLLQSGNIRATSIFTLFGAKLFVAKIEHASILYTRASME